MQMRRMAINDAHGEYIGDYADGSANFTLTRSCIGLRAKLIEADNTVAGSLSGLLSLRQEESPFL